MYPEIRCRTSLLAAISRLRDNIATAAAPGTPVALAEIEAVNRTFPALSQTQMLHAIRSAFCPQGVGAGKLPASVSKPL